MGDSRTSLPSRITVRAPEIDAHMAEDDDARRAMRRANAAQHGAYPRQQLLGAERFCEVVVGAEVERAHLVGLLAPRADDDHGGPTPVLHLVEDLPAVHEGKADVEEHDVDALRVAEHL